MESVAVVTRIIHVGLAAAWFGHKLLIPSDLRDAMRSDGGSDGGLILRVERAQRVGLVTGFGTLVTGIVLVILAGPAAISRWIYAGLTLVIAMFAIGALLARPAWIRFKTSLEDGDRSSAQNAADMLSRALNVESIVWVAVLITMVI